MLGRRRCVDITRNVAAVAPERSSLAYGPVVPEEHNSSRSITPRAIISSFQRDSPEVFLPPPPPSLSRPSSFSSFSRRHATLGPLRSADARTRRGSPPIRVHAVRVPYASLYGMYTSASLKRKCSKLLLNSFRERAFANHSRSAQSCMRRAKRLSINHIFFPAISQFTAAVILTDNSPRVRYRKCNSALRIDCRLSSLFPIERIILILESTKRIRSGCHPNADLTKIYYFFYFHCIASHKDILIFQFHILPSRKIL